MAALVDEGMEAAYVIGMAKLERACGIQGFRAASRVSVQVPAVRVRPE
jgi:hypothetical protein